MPPPVPFLLVLVALFGLTIGITLYPLGFVKAMLKLKDVGDMSFKLLLLGMATLNFVTAFMLEVGGPGGAEFRGSTQLRGQGSCGIPLLLVPLTKPPMG